MTTQTEALKLALEALKRATNYDPVIARAITAIKEALAQPEQEPQPPYEFDRYVAGSLRAQGVMVERATSLADAIRIAVKICPPASPPSFPTVLVYKAPLVQAQPEQEPVALQMDVIVVNLVREGINKHRARELAEHFIKNTTLPQPKPLTDEAAMFAAQHKFLEWNRQQDGRPVKVAYEYGVFQKAIELYNEAAHGIKE